MRPTKPKKDIFFKMYVKEMTSILLDKFEHISQVKQFGIMLKRVNKTDMTWASYDAEHEAIRNLVKNSAGEKLSKITIKKNVSFYVKVGLLLRLSRGVYKINPEYVKFGEDGE